MLGNGDNVLIGLSGGPDSVCLSVILDKLRDNFNISLHAVYINHGLRPDENREEEAFCRNFCEKNKILFHSRSIDVLYFAKQKNLNVHEAARELRFHVFDKISAEIKADRIALGHNADDQAETFLMRLIRGSGKRGLSGIPPVRDKIIRPLIEVERKDIEEFLEEEINALPLHSGRPYIIDTSNLKQDYFRNWIRMNLMKEIKGKNPSVVSDICRAADILREEDEYMEMIVTKTLMRLISRKGERGIELFITPLVTMDKPVLRRVLRRAIDATSGLRGIGFVHIEDIINLVKKGKAGDRIHLPKGIRAVNEYSVLKITSEELTKMNEYEVQPPCEVNLREAGKLLKSSYVETINETADGKTSALIDVSKLKLPLLVRSRSAGDFFYPLGLGKRKKLKDFFVDEKVPRDERDKVPIVLSGDDIVWVAGYRQDERFKVTDRTEKVLKLIIDDVDSGKSYKPGEGAVF